MLGDLDFIFPVFSGLETHLSEVSLIFPHVLSSGNASEGRIIYKITYTHPIPVIKPTCESPMLFPPVCMSI